MRLGIAGILVLGMVLAQPAVADSIIVDGQLYSGVTIHETKDRYYFRTPDGRSRSVARDEVAPHEILFGDGELSLGPAPAPIPVPEEMPEPVEIPEPVEMPEPEEAPAPVPVPEEMPEPEEAPAPVPVPEEMPEPVEIPEPVELPEPEVAPAPEALPEPMPEPEPVVVPDMPEGEDVSEVEGFMEGEVVSEAEVVAPATPAVPERIEQIAAGAPGPLEAGAAQIVLSEGATPQERLEANVLVLKADTITVAFCTLDMAAIDQGVVSRAGEILAEMGSSIPAEHLVVSATGVHTGLFAGVVSGKLNEAIFGAYDEAQVEEAAKTVALAVSVAEENLAAAQIRLTEGNLVAHGSVREEASPAADPVFSVMAVERHDGEAVAYLWNYALIPPVVFGDVATAQRGMVGAVAEALRDASTPDLPVLFMNGAAADIIPREVENVAVEGEAIAQIIQLSLEDTEARQELALVVTTRHVPLPDSLLGDLAPQSARIQELRLDGAVLIAVPAAPAAVIGNLLRAKAKSQGAQHVFFASLTGDYAGIHSSPQEFFYGGEGTRMVFSGPSMVRWYDEHFFASTASLWKQVAEWAPYEPAYQSGQVLGTTHREAIIELWQNNDAGLANLSGILGAMADRLPADLRPLVQGLRPEQLPTVGKQFAATFMRTEYAELTPVENAKLLGVSDAVGLPFDGVLLLQILSETDKLPTEASAIIRLYSIRGWDFIGDAEAGNDLRRGAVTPQ